MHLAAFASHQDWDAIFFHYYMGYLDKGTIPDENTLGRCCRFLKKVTSGPRHILVKIPCLLRPWRRQDIFSLAGHFTGKDTCHIASAKAA